MAETITKISLRRKLVKIHEPRRKGALISYLRQSIARSAKVEESAVKIDRSLNEYLLRTSNPMARLELKVTKEANGAKVSLAKAPTVQSAVAPATKPAAAAPKKAEQKKEAKQEKKAEAKPAQPKEAKAAPKPKEQPAK
ncbi:MAG: hypothetical protein KGH59_03780 [Candidatus Micrarchaeota archaeon]|nr:hypothetical protein [Candidatus Micrarchaeota archaeon]MDE1804873.1 hypothetical protein [Candidatus Micrarchaeota archaeon]MDE1847165.1 hypothetical protein [Candidatus Micrarchaeota archaeon]